MGFRQPPRGLRRLSFFIICGLFCLGFLRYRVKPDLEPFVKKAPKIKIASEFSSPPLKPTIPFADASATHTYLPNGLLEVNPDAPHPIFAIVKDAEAKWKEKMDKASTTLAQAVEEYKRRYKRFPPKGFDDWWIYAQGHNIQLPDEYDYIYHTLEPFWGISPEDLIKIQTKQQEETDTFTLSRNETHDTDLARVAFSTPDRWRERALLRGRDEIFDLLQPVEHLLPPFRAIFSPHDNPNLLTDYHVKKAFLDAARDGKCKHVDVNNLPKVDHYGFASACPPGTPARMTEGPVDQFNRPQEVPSKRKTFIHDHQAAMDPCTNPSIFYNHGQYVAHDLGPRPRPTLAMQFSYCTTPLYHDIQPPTFISWTEDVTPRENDPPWEEKTDERLLWRGSNTGVNHNAHTRWTYAQRIHLVRMANEQNGTERVLFPASVGFEAPRRAEAEQRRDELWRVGEGVEMRKAVANPAMMDIAFTGEPLGCDPKYCAYLKTLFEWRSNAPANSKEVGNHKYFVDVDGNGWSSRFKRLITTNSLVFKATAYPEWWIDRIQPWVHYVPVQVDYSDLYDAYAFFRGGLYGEGNHDAMAKKIASAGRAWSKAFWRKEDMTAYFFRRVDAGIRSADEPGSGGDVISWVDAI